jgi:uncharacterized protein GlcG (DUF336 family)
MPKRLAVYLVLIGLSLALAPPAPAEAAGARCPANYENLLKALQASVKPTGGPSNGGLDNNEWAAVVARDGTICAVAYSGHAVGEQWPGSRAIAAEKAFTANGMSLNNMALSTANLYAGAQPGGYLYGGNTSNPASPALLYAGDAASYGTKSDPLVGKVLVGIIVFGGGLALYDNSGVIGGLGASGDTSCADHNIAWRIRHALGLDKVPAGPMKQKNDAIIYDIGQDGKSPSGFGHPTCGGMEADIARQIGAGSGNGK